MSPFMYLLKISATGKFCLLTAFWLAAAPLCAQLFEQAEDRGTNSIYSDAFYDQDSLLIVTGNTLNCGWEHFVQCFDVDGDILWGYDCNYPSLSNSVVFPTSDDQLVLFSFLYGDDVPVLQPYFQLISSSGALISEYFPTLDLELQSADLIQIKPVNIGEQVGFVVSDYNNSPDENYKLVSFAINGELLFNINLGNAPVHHVIEFENYFAVFTEVGLILVNSNGNIVTEIPYTTAPTHVLALPNGKLLTAGENSFTELDQTLQWIEVSSILAPENLVQWAEFGNNIYMMVENEILVFDLDYMLLQTIPYNLLPHLENITLACRTGYFAIAGARVQTPSTPSLNSTAVVYTVFVSEDAEPGGDAYPDVALKHLNITTEDVTYTVNNGIVAMGFVSGELEVYLVNRGNITLDVANITSNLQQGFFFNCWFTPQYAKYHYDNLNLAPDDSTLLTATYQNFFAISATLLPLNLSVCAVSSIPNQLSDRDASNDMACGNVQITTSTNELKSFSPLKIFPNPASTSITIELPNHIIISTTLLNMQGREVLSVPLQAGTLVVDVRLLPKGMYLLRAVEIGGGVYTSKLIFI